MSENKLIDRSFLRHLLIPLFFIGIGLFGFWLDKGTMGRLVSLQRECIGKPKGTKGFECSFRENKEFIKLINPKAPAISYSLKARSPDRYLPSIQYRINSEEIKHSPLSLLFPNVLWVLPFTKGEYDTGNEP